MAARKFLVPIDLGKLELQNAAVQNLGTAPSSPVKGQIYFDTGTNTLFWWDGTTWQSAKGGGGTISYGTITAEQTFSAAKNDGVATTVARSDHAHGNPTHVAGDHASISISALSAPYANLNMAGMTVTNLATPLNATDAATKGYTDGLVAGLSWKQAVRVATTAAGTLATSFANGQVVDGVTLATGDRILIKNQATGGENGIYVVTAGTPTRATDNDAAAEFTNAACYVSSGTTNADTAWVNTTDQPITVGTTATVWVQFTGAQSIVAGAGLSSSGNTINVGSAIGINVLPDNVGIDRATNVVPLLYTTNIGDGSSTTFTVTHNLNSARSQVIIPVLIDMSSLAVVEADIVIPNNTQVTVNFAVAPAANAYKLVLVG